MAGRELKAIILARGLGTRMRKADAASSIDPDQARVADSGLKAMIPIGRPFLDYILSAVADAGVTDVTLVIGPEHDVVREYYGKTVTLERLRVSFAIQSQPRGTADAVASAIDSVGAADCLVLNGDNYYPPDALRALVGLDGPGVVVFGRDAMIRDANVPADRIRQYAVVRIGANDELLDIVEKPGDDVIVALGDDVFVSMNCWRFSPAMLDACRRVAPSPRGELELPDAVRLAMDKMATTVRVIRMNAGVLDLSSRADIAAVKAGLEGVRVRL
jgi:dTDP-glucose pyrophosphorylase